MTTVIFPDAELVVIDHLSGEYDARGETAIAVRAVPKPRPAKFVTVRRTGGERRDLVIDRSILTVGTWTEDADDTSDLAELTRALIHAMANSVIGGVTCYRVEDITGPEDSPDPDSAQPRHTFTVAIGMRGVAEQS